ncbi:aromatic-ring-hydroxylating dioxygenase subunit beta [Xanthobacter autotrophicus DSM 431]|uniref:aromatic-ring-hydroxylating dioxygenase subunit beta n=1 Tax=Xanthobacter nonsaccharivorans TaxID=3119912 RepID=UPI003726B614
MLSTSNAPAPSREDLISALLLKAEVEAFNAAYCSALDEQRLMDWAGLFTPDGFYTIVSRENFDRRLPVGLIYCENRGMIRDRAFALEKTAMFAPRYLRHMVSNLTVAEEADGIISAAAHYVVFQVLFDRPDATIHQVGRYMDRFRRTEDGLRLASRTCVYDSLLIDNALCIPV